ncbi:excalibur calcium-binding domain-containing protein [Xylanimonas protaetiae]|uniref:Excalibur calcium-binding domain-containing protein n=1 Tax=Xylanimonas protaetiae TaxID=2509457 RepID=A0A4P6F338_9MICO|nr:excalibur calcium-binding domain-containing protein [Xylanimonas protaetiae]QAY69605.1 hypothetical protein ET471_05755 [Xylanimonas protaetiae]
MAARFNPPPGWQVPAGFRPEPGWSPDPAWPVAPAGWEYWIEDAPVPHEQLHETLHLGTVAAPPAPPTGPGAPAASQPRTRSVAREGAAIPLPDGPLGHLRDGGVPASTAAPSSAAPSGAAPSRARRRPRYLVPMVAVACFALGVIVGVIVSLAQATDASQAALDASRAQEKAAAELADLQAQRADLESDTKALDDREADLTARESAVAQKEADQASRQTQLDQQAQQAQQQNQQNAQQPAQGTGGTKHGGFQTCDDLRAAGVATPIKRGDPGYSRLLDLDDNNYACD